MTTAVSVVGWARTTFGRRPDHYLEALLAEIVVPALPVEEVAG